MLHSKTSKSTCTGKEKLKSPRLRSRPPGQPPERSLRELKRKRVWKACERCKIKKIKCDAATPCRRCKDDGMICVTKSRRRTEFASVPQGYAEVLENTHFSLVATIEKLYSMLRNGEGWLLEEPQKNEHGAPIIHDIAKILCCLRETEDNVWSIPDLQEQGRKNLLPKQEHMDGPQQSFASDNSSSPHFAELEYLSQVSDSTSSALTQDKVVQPDHGDDCLMRALSHEYPLPALEEPPEKQFALLQVPMQDSNRYACQMNSSWNRVSEANISFNTIITPYESAPELSIDMLDLTMWSDEVAWKSFTDA